MRIQKTLILAILFASGCTRNDIKPSNDKELLSGLWVPYEIINQDGVTIDPPVATYTIFDLYAGCVQFDKEGKYFPAIWVTKDNYFVFTIGGSFEYTAGKKKLILSKGQMNSEFEVTKLLDDDLWLKSSMGQFKFKREMK